MDVRVGCTGWGYDDWVGPFYPAGTPAAEYLERYARVFALAEVDSTYYRAPTRALALRWAAATPEGFLFAPKFPAAITHEKRLRGVDEDVERFLDALAPLAEAKKLGPLVAQTGPGLDRGRHGDDLARFLDLVPREFALAVELRHASWWTEATYAALRARGAALAWSTTEYGRTPAVETADFAYLRLIGDRALTRFDRVQRDGRAEMERWKAHLDAAKARVAYVLLNNHFMGFAPATAQLLQDVLGLPRADLALAGRRPGQRGLGEWG